MNNEVIVINRNPKSWEDGFSGMKWTFAPNEKVSVPLAAAVHMFGFNVKDKTPTLRRLGLANHPDGEQWLKNIELKYVEYVAKDDAEEAEQLKIDLAAKQAEIDDLTAKLEAATTEINQLNAKLTAATASNDDKPKTTKK
jgi:hypothetical protein